MGVSEWTIKEQVVEDLPTGLTIEFVNKNDGLAWMRLRGDILPFGNREIGFDVEGMVGPAGTFTGDYCIEADSHTYLGAPEEVAAPI